MKVDKPRFEVLEHTADIRIAAYGKDLKEAFANMAYGLFAQIADLSNVEEKESQEIEVTGFDLESLLVNWLNELLFVFDVDNLLLKRFNIVQLEPTHIKAMVYGEKTDLTKHTIFTSVKAATYHQIEIEQGDGVIAKVIFDV